MVIEHITDAISVNLSVNDWIADSSEARLQSFMLFAETAGTVKVGLASGITQTKTLAQGEYWRVRPIKIFKTGTTATVQACW